ncbi:MAG: hypothetical protein MMC23_002211 [Stictis urceolatum]|nr:hypothetical protein [Stictis urceolata]
MNGAVGAPTPKPFSISLGPKKSQPGPVINTKKRPHSSLAADGSDEEDEENEGRGKVQLVSQFDSAAGGAIENVREEPTTTLVISKQKNRNWREETERKKGKNLLPAEELARRNGAVQTRDVPDLEEKERTWGLVIPERKSAGSNDEVEVTTGDESKPVEAPSPRRVKTADEEALEALIGGEKKDSGLIIPNAAPRSRQPTERDVYKSDVASRPDMASLDAYGAVPVEDFGRALMRGMGWKEGQEIGRKKGTVIKEKKRERRPVGLGIGAKETPEGLEEPGAWGKNAKKSRKAEAHFNPLLMKNEKTGEILTEEEFKAVKDREKLLIEDVKDREKLPIEDDWKERRDRKLAKDEERKSERRHRDRDRGRDRDYDSSRHSSRYDRSSSPKRERRRDRGRDYDRERDRRKERDYDDRRRDKHRDREGERDKYRSRDDSRYDSKDRRDRRD